MTEESHRLSGLYSGIRSLVFICFASILHGTVGCSFFQRYVVITRIVQLFMRQCVVVIRVGMSCGVHVEKRVGTVYSSGGFREE